MPPADIASCSAQGKCSLPDSPARSGYGLRSAFSTDCALLRQAYHPRQSSTSCVWWSKCPQASPRFDRWRPHHPGRSGAAVRPPMPDKNNLQAVLAGSACPFHPGGKDVPLCFILISLIRLRFWPHLNCTFGSTRIAVCTILYLRFWQSR